jgi:membrane protein YdbS with pleckstrin-like domain
MQVYVNNLYNGHFLRTKKSAHIRPSVVLIEYRNRNVPPWSHSCYVIIVLLTISLTIFISLFFFRHRRMLYADVTSSSLGLQVSSLVVTKCLPT